jgi:hypothetical protein
MNYPDSVLLHFLFIHNRTAPMMHYFFCCCIALSFCALPSAMAQTPAPMPNTIRQSMQALGDIELYLVDIEKSKSTFTLGKPVNITRRPGYDNQPVFTPDSRSILYVSMREDSQTDVYKYFIKDSSTTQITKTPESEYTPSILPADGQSIVVVRVEQDSTQRLWRFDANGKNPIVLLDSVKGIGYYSWLGASNLGLFVLGRERNLPFTLQITPFDAANPHGTGLAKPDTIESKIGRCIRRIPTSIAGSQLAASFVHKTNDSVWMIKRVNVKNHIVSQICPTVTGAEDYAWTQNGTLIMGQGLKLFARQARKDSKWREIADFGKSISQGYIKRLAISPDEKCLVFVVQEKP